jgi:predicted transposase YdaD
MTLADQLREEGKLEGKIEGKQEGINEGQLRAFRTSVLRALEIRHGAYPEGVREAIDAVEDPKQLENLLESAFRSDSIEAFAQNL